jgi:hypothetical protein
MKSLPVTHKATRSPLKLSDDALVKNDAQTHKTFVDVADSYTKGREDGDKQTPQALTQREVINKKIEEERKAMAGLPAMANPNINVVERKK